MKSHIRERATSEFLGLEFIFKSPGDEIFDTGRDLRDGQMVGRPDDGGDGAGGCGDDHGYVHLSCPVEHRPVCCRSAVHLGHQLVGGEQDKWTKHILYEWSEKTLYEIVRRKIGPKSL